MTFDSEMKLENVVGSTLSIEFPVSYRIMETILKYVYTAEMDVTAEMIPELLEKAVKFKIPSLRRHCVYAIQNG